MEPVEIGNSITFAALNLEPWRKVEILPEEAL
jgi:hypothetical protein